MADQSRPSQPIPPGSRVAVFLDERASGATLGYYGTLVGVSEVTMRFNPHHPERWPYSIHVPALGRVIQLEADAFLVTRTVDGQEQLVAATEIARVEAMGEPWELWFACPVGADNHELYGRYRFGQVERGLFHFRKDDQFQLSFQFRLPALQAGSNRGLLTFHVPAHEVLDRSYVFRALVTVLGRSFADKSVYESFSPDDRCEIVT